MRFRFLALAGAITALGLIAVACGGGGGGGQAPAPTPTPTAQAPSTGQQAGQVVEVDLKSFEFVPNNPTFEKGKTYTLKLVSKDIFHTFTVNDLGINVPVNAKETKTVTFTPDKTGTFKLICLPHVAQGMTGTVTVK